MLIVIVTGVAVKFALPFVAVTLMFVVPLATPVTNPEVDMVPLLGDELFHALSVVPYASALLLHWVVVIEPV